LAHNLELTADEANTADEAADALAARQAPAAEACGHVEHTLRAQIRYGRAMDAVRDGFRDGWERCPAPVARPTPAADDAVLDEIGGKPRHGYSCDCYDCVYEDRLPAARTSSDQTDRCDALKQTQWCIDGAMELCAPEGDTRVSKARIMRWLGAATAALAAAGDTEETPEPAPDDAPPETRRT
jgi:hypothetical protein